MPWSSPENLKREDLFIKSLAPGTKRSVPQRIVFRPTVLTAIIVVFMITSLVLAFAGNGSSYLRLEVSLGIIAGLLYMLLGVGLYQGARVIKERISFNGLEHADPAVLAEGLASIDDLAGLGLWLAATVALILLQLLASGLLVLIFASLTFIIYRALRLIFFKHRQCRGSLRLSLRYAALYTFLYTSWLLGLLTALHKWGGLR